MPAAAQVKAQLDAFLQTRTTWTSRPRRRSPPCGRTGRFRADVPPRELLDQVAATLALVDDNAQTARRLLQHARRTPSALPDFPVSAGRAAAGFRAQHLRLLYGRWLAQHQCYDEALEQLQDLTTADVVDPAALLFYQGVSYHRMPDKRQCVPLVARLLENQQQIPRRYLTVAQLIQADIAPLETDSLDEISRLMDEVRRRLELKRAGTRVRQQEDEVIAKLDKLIKKIEEQQQQQQQQAAAAGNLQPSNPAQDSMPMRGQRAGQHRSQTDRQQVGLGQFAARRATGGAATDWQGSSGTLSGGD